MCKECETIAIDNLYKNGEEVHSIYKCGNNTPEQYEEFKKRFLRGGS